MKTITVEIDDTIADKIAEVVSIRERIGEPTTPEKLASVWLSTYVGERLASELVRFRGLEGRHVR